MEACFEWELTLAKLYDQGWPTLKHVRLENQKGKQGSSRLRA
tara:strand:- start:408 stop:533 length:126 start_codon:yes stop_codon:yes gene_type:complete